MIFTSTIQNMFKKTLSKTINDPGGEPKTDFRKYCIVKTQTDAYEDDLETGGPGLAAEVAEGAEFPQASMSEGTLTRYTLRKLGLRMVITEETMEDSKYPEAIALAKRLVRSIWKTIDIDVTSMLVRAFNASYTGGDGQPLCSASHTLPNGGTFSNTMATPVAPSVSAVIAADNQAFVMPDHAGITEGYMIKKVICPPNQRAVWSQILHSTKEPDNDTNAINVVNHDMNITVVPVKHWQNTTTNYIFQTDAEDGLQVRFKRKPRTRTWAENSQELMQHSISTRFSRGWSEPRAVIGAEA